jgi:hypothetical protein
VGKVVICDLYFVVWFAVTIAGTLQSISPRN